LIPVPLPAISSTSWDRDFREALEPPVPDMDSPGAVWGRDMKRSDLDSPGHSSLLKPAGLYSFDDFYFGYIVRGLFV
jgi:hypothetical protein